MQCRGEPAEEAVTDDRKQPHSNEKGTEEIDTVPHEAQRLTHADVPRSISPGHQQTAAWRIAHGEHQQTQQHARQPRHDKHHLPAAHLAQQWQHVNRIARGHRVHHQPAEDKRQPRTDRDTHVVDPESAAKKLTGEGIPDQRIRRRRQRRLPHAHAHPCRHELPETGGQPASGSGNRPQEHADGDNPATAEAVYQPAGGDTQNAIKNRESEALQQTDLRIAHAELALDGIDQQTEDLAVDEREHVEHHQHAHQVPRLCGCGVGIGGA